MKSFTYSELNTTGIPYYGILAVLGIIASIGLVSAWHMEHSGHYVTGMTNQVVWGLPHVFAVFLIVSASGALNVASIGSVFGRLAYKPLARLSGLLAIALLVGGLSVLLLDLGRPDRLIVAMTHYNFKSIFAWNIFLYTGFIAIAAIYLWTLMDRSIKSLSFYAGIAMFIWRLALTTGTGLIFGFLVAREAYDAALLAPLFIAMSFAFGLAIFILVLIGISAADNRPLGNYIVQRMGNLMVIFIASNLYFITIQHLTGLYAAEHTEFETFLLTSGSIYTWQFWIVQIGMGCFLPLIILMRPQKSLSRSSVIVSSVLVIIGGLAQLYVIIIGGQAYPLILFPGMIEESSFFDGVINNYVPSFPELGLGIGGIAISAILVVIGTKILRFLPVSLADSEMDPNNKPLETEPTK
ncbi:MAG: NrfD/PsrC family molybdoenzyme membrane anchor subunit [Pseudomonadota bacterium]|nr:NrfD/PsrC family molybdoenzyme membrane anchor subunit [Pseudomonadota bacterium]